MLGSIYTLVALGLTLIFGMLGVLNFAQGQLMMLGGYCGYFLTTAGAPFGVALIASMGVVALVAAAMELTVFRRVVEVPINGLIISIGLIGILQNGTLLVVGADPHHIRPPFPGATQFGGVVIIWERALIFVVTLALVTALALFLRKSKWGKAMRATLQNREAAELMGIPTRAIVTLSFAIGGGLAAASGVLMGSVFPVDPFMGDNALQKGFIVLVLGGVGNPLGTVLAGFVVGIAESFGGGYLSANWQDAFGYVLLFAVLLLRPRGLLPERIAERSG
jgi:branched-chain amino acid transport system permease protein